MGIQFANPQFFVLLIFVPLLIYWYWRKERRRFPELQLSTLESFKNAPKSWRQRFRHLLFVLRILAVILLIVALARPQSTSRGEKVTTEGIDIVLVTDISGSMLAEDFKPNRIEAAKNVSKDFVAAPPNERIEII